MAVALGISPLDPGAVCDLDADGEGRETWGLQPKSAAIVVLDPGGSRGVRQVRAVLVLCLLVLPEIGDAERAVAPVHGPRQAVGIAEVALNELGPGCGQHAGRLRTAVAGQRPHRIPKPYGRHKHPGDVARGAPPGRHGIQQG